MIRSGRTEQRMARRAAVVLLSAQGLAKKQIAARTSATVKTVRKWEKRYLASGIKGLYDLPRQGAPSKFSVQQRMEIIAIACDSPQNYCIEGYNRWTYDLLVRSYYKKGPGSGHEQDQHLSDPGPNRVKTPQNTDVAAQQRP